ncbi:hypothetical protein [Selenomonas ruminantium]|uniref:Uncharacterized protein n=1 Tax=Selenomonas ruminantium TaxID=971 RepID=A0A1H0N3P1_SELRU|nr:hypothetical protein [Selenomonas ruminantium]SDO87136.1 hypothetical protein SAMN05216366_102157 [Selenomonas ruminantium]
MEYLRIEAQRQAYGPDDLKRKTMTVGELKRLLEDFDEDLPVILSHDNGYTYGSISDDGISEDYYADEVEDSYGEGSE